MDFDGQLKYTGQVRKIPVMAIEEVSESEMADNNHQQGDTPPVLRDSTFGNQQEPLVNYEIARCGYGNLVWPDGSNFEGYWIDG